MTASADTFAKLATELKSSGIDPEYHDPSILIITVDGVFLPSVYAAQSIRQEIEWNKRLHEPGEWDRMSPCVPPHAVELFKSGDKPAEVEPVEA